MTPLVKLVQSLLQEDYTSRSIEALTKETGLDAPTVLILLGIVGATEVKGASGRPYFTVQTPAPGFSHPSYKPNAEDLILEALSDERFTFRSIEALAKAVGWSVDDTRAIVEDMPEVRRNSGARESYTLGDNAGF